METVCEGFSTLHLLNISSNQKVVRLYVAYVAWLVIYAFCFWNVVFEVQIKKVPINSFTHSLIQKYQTEQKTVSLLLIGTVHVYID